MSYENEDLNALQYHVERLEEAVDEAFHNELEASAQSKILEELLKEAKAAYEEAKAELFKINPKLTFPTIKYTGKGVGPTGDKT